MRVVEVSSKQYFSKLSIVHIALISGQIIFAVVAYFLVSSGAMQTDPSLVKTFNIVVPVMIGASVLASIVLFKTLVEQAKTQADIKNKMKAYRSALILRFALLEAPAIVALVGYVLTGQILYLGAAAIMIAISLVQRPSAATAIKDLGLDYSEAQLVEDPEAIIGEYTLSRSNK